MNDVMVIVSSLLIALLLILFYLIKFKFNSKRKTKISVDFQSDVSDALPLTQITESNDFFTALSKSREQFTNKLKIIFSAGLSPEVREDFEALLLQADVGVETTDWVISVLFERAERQGISESSALLELVKQILGEILDSTQKSIQMPVSKPFVILLVGVNGVGKTTTIGKLAHKYKKDNKKVLLGAGDTFRAAAAEQLKSWGDFNDVPVISQHVGADSASVLYDACESAKARGFDIVLADTAGRLQNKSNLMNELAKISRVLDKLDIGAPHEVLLVLDAGTGQNAVSQAREFLKAVRPTGLVLTKLDGTAKGGIIFALSREFNLPIRYIGVGENIEDLRVFHQNTFIDALFADRQT